MSYYLGIDLEDWYLDVAGVAVGAAHRPPR